MEEFQNLVPKGLKCYDTKTLIKEKSILHVTLCTMSDLKLQGALLSKKQIIFQIIKQI